MASLPKLLLLTICSGLLGNVIGTFRRHTKRFRGQRNLQMPEMLYGTAWKEERTASLVKKALEMGFIGIDTANQPVHYREDLVGEGLANFLAEDAQRKRSDIFLQTKFSPGQEMSSYANDLIPYASDASLEDQVAQSCTKSLENLRTSYIDSLVLHSPLRSLEDTMTVWHAMEKLVSEGKVNQLGISNIYSLPQLQAVYSQATVKPTVVQNHFAADSCFDDDLRKWSHAHGIRYQSFWTLTANKQALLSTPVQSVVSKLALTKEQAWFLFVMSNAIVPLTGTSDADHMKEDLALLGQAHLTSTESQDIWDFVNAHTNCNVTAQ